MNITGVEDRAVAVISLLRKEGRATDAHDMAHIAAQLRSPEGIEDALEGIIERCNIRWLGDVPLRKIGSSEWLQALNALENSSRAELLSYAIVPRSEEALPTNQNSALPCGAPHQERQKHPGQPSAQETMVPKGEKQTRIYRVIARLLSHYALSPPRRATEEEKTNAGLQADQLSAPRRRFGICFSYFYLLLRLLPFASS